ncbi:MAG: hypothetical protein WCG83_00155 [Candidatus Peregrinibacteria bacterium]
MSSLWIAIGSWIVFILLIEGTMWMLFNRRFHQICLPNQGERTFFSYYTIWRNRLAMILHISFLIAVIVIAYIFLWP